MEIILRQQALKLGLKKYFTGEPCKHGHIYERRVDNCSCVKCNYLNGSGKDPEKNRKRVQKWRDENPEKAKDTAREGQKKYAATSAGRLRYAVKHIINFLCCSNMLTLEEHIPNLVIINPEYVSYTSSELQNHLLKNLPFESIREARENNYHLDHIIPIKYIDKMTDSMVTKIKIALDLENLRLIKKEENHSKKDKISSPEVQEKLDFMCKKYQTEI